MLAVGGEVWVGDETTLREFPPLRAGWSKRGEQTVVTISGRNARRVVHRGAERGDGRIGASCYGSGSRGRCAGAVAALGAVRPEVPKLLIWDNAPPPPIGSATWPRRAASTSRSCPSARPS